MSITKDDLKALRNADRVIFRKRGDYYCIEAVKSDDDEFGGRERSREIEVQGYLNNYSRSPDNVGPSGTPTTAIGFAYGYDDVWETIVSVLKVGDIVALNWLVSNNSQTLRDANLCADELRIRVLRKLPSGKDKNFVFNVDHRVCPPYSSARMVTDFID